MPRTRRTTHRTRHRTPTRARQRFVHSPETTASQPILAPGPHQDGHARGQVMFDETERLRQVEGLCALLERYALLARPDRQVWQDRVQELDALGSRELVRLHGELLAHGWVEQNTGMTPNACGGTALGCYRITPAGIRALKQLHAAEVPAGS
jgi:hypothetical protein